MSAPLPPDVTHPPCLHCMGEVPRLIKHGKLEAPSEWLKRTSCCDVCRKALLSGKAKQQHQAAREAGKTGRPPLDTVSWPRRTGEIDFAGAFRRHNIATVSIGRLPMRPGTHVPTVSGIA